MIKFILSLPLIVGGIVSMALATVVGLAVYFIFHKLIDRYQRGDLKDPTSSLFRVVGMLVSLMLSLAFADVVVDMRAVENAAGREVIAISDMFHDLQRFDIDETRDLQVLLAEYAQAIIDDDWPALAVDQLGLRADSLRIKLEDGVLALRPGSPDQEVIRDRLLTDVDAVSDYRMIRLDSALSEPPIYLFSIYVGFLITMACFGAYRPQAPLILLVSLYTLFVGLVLYLILSLSDPYQGGTGVDPSTFKNLAETLRSRLT